MAKKLHFQRSYRSTCLYLAHGPSPKYSSSTTCWFTWQSIWIKSTGNVSNARHLYNNYLPVLLYGKFSFTCVHVKFLDKYAFHKLEVMGEWIIKDKWSEAWWVRPMMTWIGKVCKWVSEWKRVTLREAAQPKIVTRKLKGFTIQKYRLTFEFFLTSSATCSFLPVYLPSQQGWMEQCSM